MLIAIGAVLSGVLFILQVTGLVATLTVLQILAPLLIAIGISVVIWIVVIIFALLAP